MKFLASLQQNFGTRTQLDEKVNGSYSRVRNERQTGTGLNPVLFDFTLDCSSSESAKL